MGDTHQTPGKKGSGNIPEKTESNVADFGLTSRQCYLLLVLEGVSTLTELAHVTGKDPSVVSRELKLISALAPVLEKQGGSWVLTPVGKQLNRWTRSAVASQREILGQQTNLRIAAPPEFVNHILGPQFSSLLGSMNDVRLSILSAPDGIEKLLLEGKCDFGFDSGRPTDPVIRFRKVAQASLVVVAAPSFLKKHDAKTARDLVRQPYLHYDRAPEHLPHQKLRIEVSFNEATSVREACIAGLGWSILPAYIVKSEVEAGKLALVEGWTLAPQQLGVWWSSHSRRAGNSVERAIVWLAAQTSKLK